MKKPFPTTPFDTDWAIRLSGRVNGIAVGCEKMTMTEEEYIGAIKTFDPSEHGPSIEHLRLADAAVAEYPHSARLWCLRGQLIQVGPQDGPHGLSDALDSLLKAVEEDDEYAEGYEELGHFYDTVEDNTVGAEQYFRRAIAIGGSAHAYVGLARVLAELGRINEIVPLLQASPNNESPEVAEVMAEIDEGIWQPGKTANPRHDRRR